MHDDQPNSLAGGCRWEVGGGSRALASQLVAAALLCASTSSAQPRGVGLEPHAEEIARIEAAWPEAEAGDGGGSDVQSDPQGLRGPLEEVLESLGVPGLSLAVVSDYRLLWAKAYGVADEREGRAVDVETVFQAASISKPVSAMAVLAAVQDGLFALDDDINSVLATWKLLEKSEYLATTTVTPRMLLSMTAGTNVSGFPGYRPGTPLPTVPQILGGSNASLRGGANTDPVTVDWQPGSKYAYSGGGSTILQLALAQAREATFSQVLQRSVLTPLEMQRSCFCQPLPRELAANAAHAHGASVDQENAIAGASVPYHVYPELYAAGLWTTPVDLARFMIEVQLSLAGRSNRVLSAELARKMVTPGGVGHYALGFTVGSTSPHLPAPPGERPVRFGHTGGNWGFRGNFEATLEGGNGFVILANSDRANELIFRELPRRIGASRLRRPWPSRAARATRAIVELTVWEPLVTARHGAGFGACSPGGARRSSALSSIS